MFRRRLAQVKARVRRQLRAANGCRRYRISDLNQLRYMAPVACRVLQVAATFWEEGFDAPRCNPTNAGACAVGIGDAAEPGKSAAYLVQVDLQRASPERLRAEADRGARDRAHQPRNFGYQRGLPPGLSWSGFF